MKKLKYKVSYTRMILVGFVTLILLGTVLLMLPASTRSGVGMSFFDSLFTATSATCVTGLVIADTYQNWSLFGQLVILSLIQIGGLGFITIGVYVAVVFKRRIGLKGREAIHESINTMETAGVVRLTKKIIRGTLFFELFGAALLSIRFIPELGPVKGFYFGLFHSISAFCNGGFDLMGYKESYSSLVSFEGDVLVNVVVMTLIVIGGIGFLVWDDIMRNRWHVRRYLLHTKIVLITTGILIFGGAILFFLLESNNLFTNMDIKERILGSLFCSVTARTAGFNTVDVGAMTEASKLLSVMLMFVGGSPGSTAGGIKTTTLVVMIIVAWSMIQKSYGVNIFGRKLHEDAIRKASTVFIINLSLGIIATLILVASQPLSLTDAVFEVFSAIGTVGMTTGITRSLTVLSKLVIILLMFTGRLGSLSFALVFAEKKVMAPIQYPHEKIIVG